MSQKTRPRILRRVKAIREEAEKVNGIPILKSRSFTKRMYLDLAIEEASLFKAESKEAIGNPKAQGLSRQMISFRKQIGNRSFNNQNFKRASLVYRENSMRSKQGLMQD